MKRYSLKSKDFFGRQYRSEWLRVIRSEFTGAYEDSMCRLLLCGTDQFKVFAGSMHSLQPLHHFTQYRIS
jgi:hypothetical protein